MRNLTLISFLTASSLLLVGCDGTASGTVGNSYDAKIDAVNGSIDDGSTPPDTTKVFYDGPAAADAQTRHEADDATDASYVGYPVYDSNKIDTTTLFGKLTGTINLVNTKQYKVDGLVKIDSGAVLNIEPGTVIFGDNSGDDYIVVMQGAQIIADGTEAQPIVFTSEEALKDFNRSEVGQWGGLVLLGRAPTNHDDPRFEVDETDPDFAFGNPLAGVGDATDNSGVLRHVKILNSGKTLGTDLEINGLSLAGVGSGTVIENITVTNSSDDCVEVWGGTVDISNVKLVNCQDDSFDLDYGYVGVDTNITVVQTVAAHAGFEISSGGDNPMTSPTIKNFTIVKVAGSDEGGIYIKDDTTAPLFINGSVTTVSESDAGVNARKVFSAPQKSAIDFQKVMLHATTYFSGTGANDTAAVFTPFPVMDSASVDTTTLVGKISSDLTLTKDKQYKVDGLVKIDTGVTLSIEAGTIIFGDSSGDDYIVVMRGAKIDANGTMEEPIIFTSEDALRNPTAADVGQWGGLTILGAAPTNTNDPHYEVDESDPDFAFGNLVAGQGDVNDDSGSLKNIYILNSGKTLGTDLEINGLSLAGVGKGTLVENVQVINSSDDCIEVWGGTVDIANVLLVNCHDDSFDLDLGYAGSAKNVVVQQKTVAHAGFEISSGGDNPMTEAKIFDFIINKTVGSDEGGIYIKDDTTAPNFFNGVVTSFGSDADIHTKKVFEFNQKRAIAFKDVILK